MIAANRREVKKIQQRGTAMTRWETRFVKTNERDIVKLVPFVLILVILEEALPLFVLYAPFLLPSTCLLASQRARIANQRAVKHHTTVGTSLSSLPSEQVDYKLMCKVLSLSSFGPNALRKRRMETHLGMIEEDDKLLLKEAEGNKPSAIVRNLSEDELVDVLAERGFCTTSVTPTYAKDCLEWYFRQQLPSESLDSKLTRVAQGAVRTYRT